MPPKPRPGLTPAMWLPLLFGSIKLLFSRESPWYCKLLVIMAGAYAIWPVDVIPDLLVGIGWVDDAAVVLGLMSIALALLPKKKEEVVSGGTATEEKRTVNVVRALDDKGKETVDAGAAESRGR